MQGRNTQFVSRSMDTFFGRAPMGPGFSLQGHPIGIWGGLSTAIPHAEREEKQRDGTGTIAQFFPKRAINYGLCFQYSLDIIKRFWKTVN